MAISPTVFSVLVEKEITYLLAERSGFGSDKIAFLVREFCGHPENRSLDTTDRIKKLHQILDQAGVPARES